MKGKSKKIVIILSIILMSIILVYMAMYFSVYRLDFNMKNFNSYESKYLDIYDNRRYIYIEPKGISKPSTGIIFYPGGLVEEEAYLPLLAELSKDGYGVYIVKSLMNIPILNSDSAENIIGENRFENYVLMGHSLGGTSLLKYFSKQTNNSKKVNEIILLASYSDSKYIFDSQRNDNYKRDIPILSIVGSNDNVINIDRYEKDKINLPYNTKYVVIEGGNHSYFGNYGKQRNDNEADISLEEQQYNTLKEIEEFLNESNVN